MRWTARIVSLIAVLWAAYAAWPFWAVYELAAAVERRDRHAIERQVNFPAVRRSLTEQIVATYLQLTGKDARLGGLGRAMTVAAAASVADPIVAELISAQALIELLENGWPKSVLPPEETTLEGLQSGSLGNAWQMFLHSEHGLRTFILPVPVAAPPPRRFKLHFRLTTWRWKLSAVELPEELRTRLARELIRRTEKK
jgi:Protein of unknown function (DUF2939)